MRFGKHPYYQTPREEAAEAWRDEVATMMEEARKLAARPAGRVLPVLNPAN